MARKAKKYHFIYKTLNLLNGKYYIGMHSTNNLNDGYIGSGTYLKRSIKKYGKDNFKFEILSFHLNRKELVEAEKKYITEAVMKDWLCMNLRSGGGGSPESFVFPDGAKKRISIESSKSYRERVGEKRAEIWSNRISKSLIKYYKKNGVSDDIRKKLSESHKGQAAWNRGKQTGLIPWNKGVVGSMVNKGCGVKKGNKAWNKGIVNQRIWIFNEHTRETKQINPMELGNFLLVGWKKGRKIRW